MGGFYRGLPSRVHQHKPGIGRVCRSGEPIFALLPYQDALPLRAFLRGLR